MQHNVRKGSAGETIQQPAWLRTTHPMEFVKTKWVSQCPGQILSGKITTSSFQTSLNIISVVFTFQLSSENWIHVWHFHFKGSKRGGNPAHKREHNTKQIIRLRVRSLCYNTQLCQWSVAKLWGKLSFWVSVPTSKFIYLQCKCLRNTHNSRALISSGISRCCFLYQA